MLQNAALNMEFNTWVHHLMARKKQQKKKLQKNLVGTWQILSLFIPFMSEAHVF